MEEKDRKPGYINLYNSGELERRSTILWKILENCTLCPRECHRNRLKGEKGFCGMDADIVVSSIHPHFGEEPELVGNRIYSILGRGGSGTIFLAGCNFLCVFCQNWEISHLKQGEKITPLELADGMIYLQERGCHNINFVTPTHFVPQIVKSLKEAVKKGLRLPLVYNCGGYEKVETLKLLEGIFDIYMPDIKFSSPEVAKKLANAPDYFEVCKKAVKEMHRQVGDLKVDERGIAYRGLLVRHLVLPGNLAGSREVLKFIAKEISKDTYVNIMFQYRPEYKAGDFEELSRRPTLSEYLQVIKIAREFGLYRGFGENFTF
ncbi:radical SAM protein [Candidatus Aerophobetes bacterium]|nr:radical SAM protein [Candidatus Aerophobetes bacterium]